MLIQDIKLRMFLLHDFWRNTHYLSDIMATFSVPYIPMYIQQDAT